MIASGTTKALLLAGDTSSVTCSPEDKSTYPLFGDAGTATLLTRSESAIWHVNAFTDGSGGEAIIVPDGQSRNRFTDASFQLEQIAPGIRRHRLNLALKGDEVFAFSIKRVPESMRSLIQFAQKNLTDIDYLVMHQANLLMNDTIRKLLHVSEEKVPYSLDEFGNTSSASIPLTLVTRLAEQLKHPRTLLLSGFGVGLSWGNILMQTSSIHCLPLIET
jgi:3-oxoacyl-[acyl-carrier-protein] synthase-3